MGKPLWNNLKNKLTLQQKQKSQFTLAFLCGQIVLNNFLTNHFRIRATHRKTLSGLHLHNHTTIEMFFYLLQEIDVDDGASVNTNECIRV
jgi:hypothetical protein